MVDTIPPKCYNQLTLGKTMWFGRSRNWPEFRVPNCAGQRRPPAYPYGRGRFFL